MSVKQPSTDNVFGQLLQDCRKERGWSFRELAARAGMEHPVIVQFENGTRVAWMKSATALAHAFFESGDWRINLFIAAAFITHPRGRRVMEALMQNPLPNMKEK